MPSETRSSTRGSSTESPSCPSDARRGSASSSRSCARASPHGEHRDSTPGRTACQHGQIMSDAKHRTVAFLGGGRMGEALVSGLIRSGGRSADEIMVTNRREERARELAERYGVATTLSNPEAAAWADVLVLRVKPQDMGALLSEIREHVTPDDLIVSFAAGIRTSFVEKRLPDDVPVVRVMSNVAVLVDEAMSVVAAGSHSTDAHLEVAEELLGYVGKVLRLKETHLDSITATSGSGPAYFFLLAEAMIEACILLGLS